MAILTIPQENRTINEPAAVAGYLAGIGVDYEIWKPAVEVVADAPASSDGPGLPWGVDGGVGQVEVLALEVAVERPEAPPEMLDGLPVLAARVVDLALAEPRGDLHREVPEVVEDRQLELSALEIDVTRTSMRAYLWLTAIGVVSALLPLSGPAWMTPIAGLLYFFIGPVMWWHWSRFSKRWKDA